MKPMSFKENILVSTVRIMVEKNNNKFFAGTSFIVYHLHNRIKYPFLITNKHIVEGSIKGKVLLRNEDEKKEEQILELKFENDFQSLWTFHENENMDIAVLSLDYALRTLDFDFKYGYSAIPESMFFLKEHNNFFDAIENIIFIGYPNSIYDRVNYLPISRKGITATPINNDYHGLPSFLIDAAVLHGSSGSPVFTFDFGSDSEKPYTARERHFFLGILSSRYKYNETEVISLMSNDKDRNELVNLGVVLKPEVIISTIERDIKERGNRYIIR